MPKSNLPPHLQNRLVVQTGSKGALAGHCCAGGPPHEPVLKPGARNRFYWASRTGSCSNHDLCSYPKACFVLVNIRILSSQVTNSLSPTSTSRDLRSHRVGYHCGQLKRWVSNPSPLMHYLSHYVIDPL